MRQIVFVLFLIFVSCGKASSLYTFNLDWLSYYNIYAYGKPPLDYLLPIHVNVITWSVYHGGLNEEELKYVRTLHRYGIKVASNFPTMQASRSVVGDGDLLQHTTSPDELTDIKLVAVPYEPCIYFDLPVFYPL